MALVDKSRQEVAYFGLARAALEHAGANAKEVPAFTTVTAPFFAKLWSSVPEDLAFAVSALAEGNGGRVVDIGSGDGRLVEALARSGYDVAGIEISDAMHHAAARRLTSVGDPVRARARLIHADFRDVTVRDHSLDGVFSVGLTVPTLDTATRRDFLAFAARTVRHGGPIVFDLLDVDDTEDAAFSTVIHRRGIGGNLEIVYVDCIHSPKSGEQNTNLLFEFIAADGTTTRYVSQIRCEILSRSQLKHELDKAGLRLVGITAAPRPKSRDRTSDPGWGISYVKATPR